MRRRKRLLLAAFSLPLSLLLLEGALRLLDPWKAEPKVRMWDFVRAARREDPDPRVSWRFQPGFKGDFGVPVRLNALGFRGAEWGPPRDGERRVLALGDSLTFGYGVREEEAWPEVLGRGLGAPWRVLNAGAIGYNTDQAWRVLDREGLESRPSAVLLLLVGNDGQPTLTDPRMSRAREAAERWERAHPFKRLLLEPRGPMEYTLLYLAYYLQWKTGFFDRAAAERAVPCPEAEAAFREALSGMAGACRDRGIPFGVLLYEDDAGIRRVLREAGIPFRVHFASPREAEPYVLCPVDAHPSPEGHRRLAESFRGLMGEMGLH